MLPEVSKLFPKASRAASLCPTFCPPKAPRKGLPVGGWPWGGQVPVAQHPLSAPPQYYAECHGVIYVIDSTDEERLSESKRAFGGYSPARGWGNGQVQSARPRCLELALVGDGAHTRSGRAVAKRELTCGVEGWVGLGSHRQIKGAHCPLSAHSREDGHE